MDKRFGGYRTVEFKKSDYKKDPSAFLFSLDAKEMYKIKAPDKSAVYDHDNYASTFGDGHDLYVCNDFKTGKGSYTYFPYAYDFKGKS